MLCRGSVPRHGGFRAGPSGVARRLERRRCRRRLPGRPRGAGPVPVPPGRHHRVGVAHHPLILTLILTLTLMLRPTLPQCLCVPAGIPVSVSLTRGIDQHIRSYLPGTEYALSSSRSTAASYRVFGCTHAGCPQLMVMQLAPRRSCPDRRRSTGQGCLDRGWHLCSGGRMSHVILQCCRTRIRKRCEALSPTRPSLTPTAGEGAARDALGGQRNS